MAKILLVEDDLDMSATIRNWLILEQHVVDVIEDGKEALSQLRFYPYDLIILDWELPGLSGVEVLKQFRSTGGTTPVLMLTGKDAVSEKEQGFDSGADDYLTKPFHPKELSARVRALLRRPFGFQGTILTSGNITLDPNTCKVTRAGEEVQLAPKEFALLEFFMRHPNDVFNAEALLDRVWSTESEATALTVRVCITRLRSKLDIKGKPTVIGNVHGMGYKLDVQ